MILLKRISGDVFEANAGGLGPSAAIVEREKDKRPHKARNPHGYRNKALILLLLDTGLRIGEVLKLEVKDADLQTGEILVAPTFTLTASATRLPLNSRETAAKCSP